MKIVLKALPPNYRFSEYAELSCKDVMISHPTLGTVGEVEKVTVKDGCVILHAKISEELTTMFGGNF